MFGEVPPEVYYSQRVKDLESRLAAAEKRIRWQGEMLERAKDLMMFDTQDQQFIHEWLSDLAKGPTE